MFWFFAGFGIVRLCMGDLVGAAIAGFACYLLGDFKR